MTAGERTPANDHGIVLLGAACPAANLSALVAFIFVEVDASLFSKHQSCSSKAVSRNEPLINAHPIAEPSVSRRRTNAKRTNSTTGRVNAAINKRTCHLRMKRLYSCFAGSMVLYFGCLWTENVRLSESERWLVSQAGSSANSTRHAVAVSLPRTNHEPIRAHKLPRDENGKC